MFENVLIIIIFIINTFLLTYKKLTPFFEHDFGITSNVCYLRPVKTKLHRSKCI
ncbi:protein of unknown function [Tenacibaculum sp. 190524A02b]|uniref:Uncharacterized protein n=1 Tax=Tenacibaculum vairaonense TaxID=3137860 RepID=A0ABP1F953_9FLAO